MNWAAQKLTAVCRVAETDKEGIISIQNVAHDFYLETDCISRPLLIATGHARGPFRRRGGSQQFNSPELDVLDGIGRRLVPFLRVLRVYERVELNDALGILFEEVFRTIFKTLRVRPGRQNIKKEKKN